VTLAETDDQQDRQTDRHRLTDISGIETRRVQRASEPTKMYA